MESNVKPLGGERADLVQLPEPAVDTWWAQSIVTELVGCPLACAALRFVSHSWCDAFQRAGISHCPYTCSCSSRRVSLWLPNCLPPRGDGLSPAHFTQAWVSQARERWLTASSDSQTALVCGPVLCPHPGCLHEEDTAELAALHAENCPVAAGQNLLGQRCGFQYAEPTALESAARLRCQRTSFGRAAVVLDHDLGGTATDEPKECACEVDDELPGLILQHLGSVTKVALDWRTIVLRGWELSASQQHALEAGAFPPVIDHMPYFALDHNVDLRLVALWIWARRTGDMYWPDLEGIYAFMKRPQGLIDSEAWSRTLAVLVPAAPGASKQRLAAKFMQEYDDGRYDDVELQLVNGENFKCRASTDAWRAALKEWLLAEDNVYVCGRQHRIEELLAVPCPSPIRREDIEMDYTFCGNNILFLTFASGIAAEQVALLVEKAAGCSCRRIRALHQTPCNMYRDGGHMGNDQGSAGTGVTPKGRYPNHEGCKVPQTNCESCLEGGGLDGHHGLVNLVLDLDLGGSVKGVMKKCICEINDGALVLRLNHCSHTKRVPLDWRVLVHRGWQLDESRRDEFVRGAFPDILERVPYFWVTDELNSVALALWVWMLKPREEDGFIWEPYFHSSRFHRQVVADEEWCRTLVLTTPAPPGGQKQQLAAKILQDQFQGRFENVELQVPMYQIRNGTVPADKWRDLLESYLHVPALNSRPALLRDIRKCLAAPPVVSVKRKDIEANFVHCIMDFIFLTFESLHSAEHFARLVEDTVSQAFVADWENCSTAGKSKCTKKGSC